jgi:hypothetical protein
MRLTKQVMLLSLTFALITIAQAQGNSETRFRIGHFAPGIGPIDVYINDEPTLTNFTFSRLNLWTVADNNDLGVEIFRAGATPDEDEPLIPATNVTLEQNEWQTLTIIGQTVDDSLRIHPIIEDYSPIDRGETRVTVFNAIPSSFPVNAYVNDTVLIAGVAFPGSQGDNDGAATIDILTGQYDLRLEAGAGDQGEFFILNDITLGTNRHYFLAAIGVRNNPDGSLETTDIANFSRSTAPQTDPLIARGTGSSFIRLGHFAPGTRGLDLYINGKVAEAAQDIEYVGLTQWIKRDAAVYEIAITANGASVEDPLIGPFNIVMEGSQWHTIAVVYNQELDTLIARIIREDYSPIPEGNGRITFFHAVPDAPPIDIAINQQVFIDALAFPGNEPSRANGAATITLGAGPIDLEIRETENPQNVYIELLDVELLPGEHYFIAAVNNVNTIDYYLQPIRQRDVVQGLLTP